MPRAMPVATAAADPLWQADAAECSLFGRDEWSWSCTGFAGRLEARFEALATDPAQAPAACEWGSALLFSESIQPAGTYRFHQCRVVTLRLICIGEGKRADGLVKGVALAQIATDGRGVPGLGMGAG
jgi:hypothetical protein